MQTSVEGSIDSGHDTMTTMNSQNSQKTAMTVFSARSLEAVPEREHHRYQQQGSGDSYLHRHPPSPPVRLRDT